MPASAAGNVVRLRASQNRSLARMIELCAAAHPYYRRVFEASGLSADDFRTVEDLRRLPTVSKHDYARDPEAFRLQLDNVPGLSLEETTLADVIYTSGTTARPTPFYDTVHDRFARIDHVTRSARIAGIGPRDTVMNLFPLTAVPHQGFLTATWAALGAGSRLLTGMTGRAYPEFPVHRRMDEAIDVIERAQVTVIWGIATYVRRLVMRAQELGKDFRSVRLALVMGEACPTGMREDIRSRLQAMGSPAPVINNGYGFTEMQGPAVECVEQAGRHQGAPEQFYFEIVDPDTGAPLPDGEPGMLLMSHLNRRGTVLLRYEVGDIVGLTHESCPHCGRSEPRFVGEPYRYDGFIKVNGTLVNPAALHDELAQLLARGIAEYQVVVTRQDREDRLSPDRLLVRLSCAEAARQDVARDVEAMVIRSAEITPAVEFLPAGGFEEITRGYKFRRFIDERTE